MGGVGATIRRWIDAVAKGLRRVFAPPVAYPTRIDDRYEDEGA